jgi:predicted enzyme related to lactoylglutathione lyase
MSSSFHGLRSSIYHVADLELAKAWYSRVLETEPYFDQPFYVGYNVGGYELGLHPLLEGDVAGTTSITYWGVDSADAMFARLIELGATAHHPISDVGDGIRIGSVRDPFGNLFGIIENPHFKVE